MKKILLTLGTAVSVAAPIASVVACGTIISANEYVQDSLAEKSITRIRGWEEYKSINGAGAFTANKNGADLMSDEPEIIVEINEEKLSEIDFYKKYENNDELKNLYKNALDEDKNLARKNIAQIQHLFDNAKNVEIKKELSSLSTNIIRIFKELSEGNLSNFGSVSKIELKWIKELIVDSVVKKISDKKDESEDYIFELISHELSKKGTVSKDISKDLWEQGKSFIWFENNGKEYQVISPIENYANVINNTYDLKLFITYSIIQNASEL